MKILLDENVSPRLAGHLAAMGISAQHVAHLGLSAKSDPEIFRYAYANDMVVLTINVGDFLTLAKGVELHPGILALRVSGLSSDEQWRCVKPAIEAWLASEDPASDLVNTVVEIFEDGKFKRYTLPPP